jgi:hypothetical protein
MKHLEQVFTMMGGIQTALPWVCPMEERFRIADPRVVD